MSTETLELRTQRVLNELLETVLEDLTLADLLRKSLKIITSVPWISLKGIREMCARVEFGQCLCGLAAEEKAIQFADGIDDRHTNVYEGMDAHGHYNVPIVAADQNVLGVLVVYVDKGHRRQELELEFFKAVSTTLSGLIRRKQLEDELENTGQIALLNSLIVTLNHEINTPLTVAKMAFNLYRKKGTEDLLDKAETALERIEEIVRKISELKNHAPVIAGSDVRGAESPGRDQRSAASASE
jgi:signal transduction protein with GAF and PtsI domain